MSPKDAAGLGSEYFADLFERVRRALAERLEPGIADLLAQPGIPVPQPAVVGMPLEEQGHAAAQLRFDEQTRQVLVRIYDVRTGLTIREVPPAHIADLAARLRRTVA